MAHKEQLEFFENFSRISRMLGILNIAEIGSLDINGTIRGIFQEQNDIRGYIGLDIGEGPGVDVVEQGHLFLKKRNYEFNLILSAECLEHNPFWRETISESILALKAPGILIFSWATTGRHVHGTHSQSAHSAPFVVEQWDSYYRNVSRKDLMRIEERKLLDYEAIFVNHRHKDLYWIGLKSNDEKILNQVSSLVEKQKLIVQQINSQYLQDYRYLLRKSFRSRVEAALKRVHPSLLDLRIGRYLRNKSKTIFSRSFVIFPILIAIKKRQVGRTEFSEFCKPPKKHN